MKNGLLYQIIATSFCVIVIISNIISAKMMPLWGEFSIPAGLITYPLTFLLSDLTTEIFGLKKAKRMVYITLAMNLLAFALLQMALSLPAVSAGENAAFQAVLGLSGLRIFSSLTAYGVSQIVDIYMYALIKRWTGLRFLWVRSNGSTWISQCVDTFIIDIIFLYWGMGMQLSQVVPILIFSITYKLVFSVGTTPLFYFLVYLNRKFLKEQYEYTM